MMRIKLRPLCASLIAATIASTTAAAVPRFASLAAKLPPASSWGAWSGVLPWPIVAIDTIVLPDGKLLIFPRNTSGQTKVYDPANSVFTSAPIPRTDLFCSGHAYLGDGRLLLAGGHIVDGEGLAHTNLFQFGSNTWSAGPDMNAGRWYPTVTTLASGDAFIASGEIDASDGINRLPQVFRAKNNTLRDLNDAEYSLPLYPFLHLAPNGKIFNAGPNQTTLYFDAHGEGMLTSVGPSQFGFRDYGTSVMYEPGKVLLIGGHDPPTNTAEVIDLNAPSPAWRYTAPMHFARRQMNATLLPDGRVLVTGGTGAPGFNNHEGAVHAAEVWDPATETWSLWSSASERRLYHSTAVLLPDGRVLSAGGGQPKSEGESADHQNAQILVPPYLFLGKRPEIVDAPASVFYGERFFLTSFDSAAVAKVTWVRLPSTTHAFDMNQRFNRLEFTPEGNGLLVTAPHNPTLCPPGHYMMFVLNHLGVPSVARMIRIGPDPYTLPATPVALAGSATRTTVALTWSDLGWTEDGYRIERSSNGGTSWIQVASPGNDDTQFTNAGLTRNRTYLYRVRAHNAAGNSAWSDTLTINTLP